MKDGIGGNKLKGSDRGGEIAKVEEANDIVDGRCGVAMGGGGQREEVEEKPEVGRGGARQGRGSARERTLVCCISGVVAIFAFSHMGAQSVHPVRSITYCCIAQPVKPLYGWM